MESHLNFLIIITSNEPWGKVWYSKQHYAFQLSKKYKVIFLNPPQPWSIKNIFSFKFSSSPINDNLAIINYKNNFPVRILNPIFNKVNDLLNHWKFRLLYKRKKILFWFFDPFRFSKIFFCKRYQTIYHVVDPFDHISTDELLAKNADLIVSVTEKYIEHYKKYNTNVIYIPHGINVDEQTIDSQILMPIKNLFKDCILFLGTINQDVDLNLLLKISSNFTEEKIVIVGPNFLTKESDKNLFNTFISRNNVYSLGEVAAIEVKYYVVCAKVCLVPYKRQMKQNIHRTPLKILNYLAQKKPIVTTLNYEIKELETNIIFTAKDEEEFIELVESGLKNELPINLPLVKEYIGNVNYDVLINKILASL